MSLERRVDSRSRFNYGGRALELLKRARFDMMDAYKTGMDVGWDGLDKMQKSMLSARNSYARAILDIESRGMTEEERENLRDELRRQEVGVIYLVNNTQGLLWLMVLDARYDVRPQTNYLNKILLS